MNEEATTKAVPSSVIRAYIDLTRLHFGFAWPILFCSGLMLAFAIEGGFDWWTLAKGALIGFLGFEAGFVLNDYVDRELDKKDVEGRLTNYWRPFKERPLASGLISGRQALTLFFILVALTVLLILTLPYPNSLYLLVLLVYCYGVEYFYQVHKRKQTHPHRSAVGANRFRACSQWPVT